MAPRERVCAEPSCDRSYKATNRFCTRHRAKWKECAAPDCGKDFWSAGSRFCSEHRYPERECAAEGCQHRFRAGNRFCSRCRATWRECLTDDCTSVYRGNALHCRSCLTTDRQCVAKGCTQTYRGTQSRCWDHRSVNRECATEGCENVYRGTTRLCVGCRTIERECGAQGCDTVFWGDRSLCNDCRKSDRECPDCGEYFWGRTTRCGPCWWRQLPADVRAALSRASCNAYRARKLAAQVAGPVSAAEYERIRNEGPCVYCGEFATEVDHIRPLASHGGWEHTSNLVPACRTCNASKRDRLLIDWDQNRVFRAVRTSPKVAAEYERQLSELNERTVEAR
ncbi:HNH endonuclease [Streptomyces sp. NPDC004684]